MKEKTLEIYDKVGYIKSLNVENRIKGAEIRILFENYLKFILNKDNSQIYKLSYLFEEYVEINSPENIKYTGQFLIKDLNKCHHDTLDELSDDELKSYFNKFTKIIEVISGIKNEKYLPDQIIKNSIAETLLDLNTEQKSAVNSQNRITYINAGPGTGKTHLILGRILKIASNDENKKLIGLAYTNLASKELKNKLDYLVYGTNLFSKVENISIGTIHSFALESIKNYYNRTQDENFNFSVLDEEEYNELLSDFSHNSLQVKEYLKENKLLTFDGILEFFLNALNYDKLFIESLKNEIDEIIIDEAQDLSKIQYEIFHVLFNTYNNINLFLVGDQRQNIFDFNGGNFKHFQNTFKNIEYSNFELKKSYRCPQKVLNFVNKFQFDDSENTKLINANDRIGNALELKRLENKFQEAQYIYNFITENYNKNNDLNEIAILFPSSFYFKEIANYLNKQNVSFKLFGGETKLNIHIRFLKNLLNLTINKDLYSLKKVILFWKNNIEFSSNTFEEIIHDLDEYLMFDPKFDLIIDFIKLYTQQNIEPKDLIINFINYCNTNGLLNKEILEIYNTFLSDIKENDLNDVNHITASLSANHPQFGKYFIRSLDIKSEYFNENEFITLSTIHSAKGLEWDTVIIPGLTANLFPNYYSNFKKDIKKFYVACTRAKKNLHFTRPASYNVPNKRGGADFVFYNNPPSVLLKYL